MFLLIVGTVKQDKSDAYIPEQSTCGLALRMREHYGMYLRVQLLYGCSTSGKNVTVMDSAFETQSAMICPLSPCETINSNRIQYPNFQYPISKSCQVPWIYGKGDMVDAHIEVTIDFRSYIT